jgi:succinate dehydrogenase / fumarate reductase flavoprotein subunit
VNLDLRDLGEERIMERLPGIRQIAMDFAGVDPITAPIPVQPGQHYSMGGIACDVECRTALAGLYAAGESSCMSVHGANRLGGNSLLETLVFGKRAGENMARDAEKMAFDDSSLKRLANTESSRLNEIRNEGNRMRTAQLREELKHAMFQNFGVFRNASRMRGGMATVSAIAEGEGKWGIKDKSMEFNQALIGALELGNMCRIAVPVCMSALAREESRGSHFRTDYPHRDDSRFLNHTDITLSSGKLALTYKSVLHDRWPVEQRRY